MVKTLVKTDDLSITTELDKSKVQFIIGTENPVSSWFYALAAPFPTINDNVNSIELQDLWKGKPSDTLPVQKLLVNTNTRFVLESLWGKADSSTVVTIPDSQMLDKTWDDQNSWAVIPFEEIQPKWKIISVDEQSPVRKDFNIEKYPLKVIVSLQGEPETMKAILEKYGPSSGTPMVSITNRDPDLLTTVVLTGVTALVRGTASMMELKGMTYPGLDIRGILREADITHISNEIPFSPKCPPPFPREDNLVFCSRPEYIELLEDVGTDIVELTGDHFQDWGPEAMLYTLDMYKKEGWEYYGGGENIEDAQRPVLLEHNSNKIAFLGCNAKAPGYAGASETQPGAAFCDFPLLVKQIKELVSKGYLPIVTFQHLEYYSYDAHPILKADFENVAKAGAVIVSGSQAHQPHAIEFFDGSFLHYGLGNLFFDQIVEGDPTRQAFIDRHVFYNGKYINTELIPIWFIDLARARLMNNAERQDLLSTIYKASGW